MKKTSRSSLVKRAQKIKLIAMDVDGVLTAGDIIILDSGEEVKLWNSKDRYVMAMARRMANLPTLAWITGRKSKAVERAAKEFEIPHVVQGCSNKKQALLDILKQRNLQPDEAAFIGDDLIDWSALELVGFSACPSDAIEELLESVHYVSPIAGGKGVFRDVFRFILKAQKKWDSLLAASRE